MHINIHIVTYTHIYRCTYRLVNFLIILTPGYFIECVATMKVNYFFYHIFKCGKILHI